MVPFQKASAPQNLTATLSGTRVVLNWQAPANTGGSNVSQYAIEYSANGGATWILTAYSYTLTANVGAAPKGQTFSYRVTARTSAGLGATSSPVSVATPATVTGAVRLNSAVSTGAGTFNLTFSAPADLGGVASYSYRVELLGANGWTTVASGTGAAVNVVALTTANRTTIFTYRVIATNSVGDSVSTSFNFRG
jgi:titin